MLNYSCVFFNLKFILDPRLKSLSEAKFNEFRSWFDQRLDDAIAAAEKAEKLEKNGQEKGMFYVI